MDTYLNKLDDSWMNLESVIVYGLGRTGEKLITHLVDFFKLKIVLIIDNNPEIAAKKEFQGIKTVLLQQVDDIILNNYKIIVLTGAMAYESIAATLIERGLKENINFCSVEQFVPEYSWKRWKRIVVCQVGTSITTACTLKCRDCCMFTAKVKCHKTYTYEELKYDADAFFRVVDKVLCYQILGGEPFLHKHLLEYIQYLGEQYGEKIGHIQILTNGTVVPDHKTLETIKKYNVFIRISDYTMQVKYEDKLKAFTETLELLNIKYSSLKQMQWSDIGFPDRKKSWGIIDADIHSHMISCSRNCQQLNDQRYYFCGTFWGAVRGGLCSQCDEEFIELNDIDVDDDNQRRLLLEYSLGNIQGKGYLNLCAYCNGFGNDNKLLIEAGIQQ